MKLAKKMLAGVLALAMVAALALTAFAATTSNLTVTATQYAKVGDKITVAVNATDMAGLESADLQFKFDSEALKYVSVDKAANSSYEFYEGDLAEEGLVTWSFYYRNAAEADCGICVITFEVLKDADATVEVIVESWDGETIDGVNAPSSVTITKKEETTAAPTTAAPAPTTAAPTTAAPVEDESEVPTTGNKIPQTGEAGVAAIAGVMALAAVAFVATRKKDEE